MKSVIVRILTAGALVASLIVGTAGAASAAPSRTTLRHAADSIVYEGVHGSHFGAVKKKYPKALNFTNDGCSVPKEVANNPALKGDVKYWNAIFHASCVRHDFGYRNYGKNLSTPGVHPQFQPTDIRKGQIDDRFLLDMGQQCWDKVSIWKVPSCLAVAGVYYTAVHLGGKKAFFG